MGLSGRAGRRAGFALAGYAFAVTMLGTTLPTPLYPLWRRSIGFSELMVTVIYAAYAVGVIAALLLFGQLSDRIGRRRTLLPGLALSGASAIAFLAVGGLAPLFIGRVLSGASAGIFTGTATAALVDLAPAKHRGRATLVATAVNMGGLGLGPLLAGLLADYAPLPVRLCFVVQLALLVPAALGVLAMPETVRARPGARLAPQRPRVPPEARATFVRAATAGFAGFALLGSFSAVAPAFLGQVLGVPSHAVLGAVVFAVFAASTGGQLLLGPVGARGALLGGCALLAGGLGMVAGGLEAKSLALFVAGGIVAGLGQGLSFRAGLSAVNEDSPAERRGEAASSFFVVLYVAISIPIIGIGLAARWLGLQTAGTAFAVIVALLALAALASLARQPRSARHRR